METKSRPLSFVPISEYFDSNFYHSAQAKELPTFKDNDFLNEGQKLQIGDDNKKYFLEKLKRDVEVGDISRLLDLMSFLLSLQSSLLKYPGKWTSAHCVLFLVLSTSFT